MIENDFSKGNVCRHILMQAVPLTIAQLIQLLYNVRVFDTLFAP